MEQVLLWHAKLEWSPTPSLLEEGIKEDERNEAHRSW